MNETLGKRIVAGRKRLGLTQDRLAEQLGVTAQAVSKWENDQSYPDITILPRLAEIFGTSVDALLGRKEPEVVHEAEVCAAPGEEPFEEEPEGKWNIHWDSDDGKWNFHWDSGRKGSLCFALWVLLVGALLLAGSLLRWNVSFLEILWPTGLMMLGVSSLLGKFSFFGLGSILFGLYYLLDNLEVLPVSLGKDLLLPVLLVLFGLSLVADALRRPKKPQFSFSHDSKNSKTRNEYRTENGQFYCVTCFGEQDHRIALDVLQGGRADVSFGDMTLDLTGCEAVSDPCRITAACSFAELKLRVPRRFQVELESGSAFGAVEVRGSHSSDPEGVIHLDAKASFGQIQVIYV